MMQTSEPHSSNAAVAPGSPRVHRASGYLAVGLATVLMGSWVVAGKVAVASLPVFLTSWLRLVIGTPVLVALAVWAEGGVPRFRLRECRWPFLEALTGVVCGSVFMLAGVRFTTASDAGILLAMIPAAAAALATLLLRERLRRLGWFGVGLGVLGLVVLTAVGASPSAHAPNRLLGNGLVLGAVLAEAVSVIVGKRAADALPPLRVALLVNLCAVALLAPFAAVQARGVDFAAIDRQVWLVLCYYGLGGVVSMWCWFSGLRRIPASTAAVFMGVPPVSTLLLSYGVLGEPFVWTHAVGIACVFIALLCVHRGGH